MNKSVTFLLISVSIVIFFCTIPSFAAHKFITPTSTPKPKKVAEIEKIELDKTELIISCPPGYSKNRFCEDYDMSVNISTFVKNPKNLALSYNYTVSGGKIIGEGKDVVWNLKRVYSGNYTITVSISGKGKVSKTTVTRNLKVITCPHCEVPCEVCPNLSVVGGGNVKAGGNVEFTINIEPDYSEYSLYKWTVSEGEIVEGQGTGKITVKTTREMIGKTVTATVSVEKIKNSNLCPVCNLTESATAFIIE